MLRAGHAHDEPVEFRRDLDLTGQPACRLELLREIEHRLLHVLWCGHEWVPREKDQEPRVAAAVATREASTLAANKTAIRYLVIVSPPPDSRAEWANQFANI